MKKRQDLEPGLLTYEVGEAGIVFKVGEFSCSIPKDNFLALIDVRSMFERFQEAGPANAGFAALDNVEAYARVYRLMRKGLVLEQAAQVIGANAETLRRFWSYAMTRWNPRNADVKAEIERQGIEEKDYCKAVGFESEGPNTGQPLPPVFLDAVQVKKAVGFYGGIQRQAEKLGLDRVDFEEWLLKNKAILDVL